LVISNNIPFEIHLTTDVLTKKRQDYLINYCTKNGLKPLLIELSRGNFMYQPMVSKVIYTDSIENALKLTFNLSDQLAKNNFSIKRHKIEVPAKFSNQFENISIHRNYSEWHGKINYINIESLLTICHKHQVHLSLNALKNETSNRFLTLREYGTEIKFTDRVNQLTKELEKGWSILKEQYEFCIYDDNTIIDKGWLTK
jgi:hypothetical protein